MTFREALNISQEMPLNYENIVNALGYEDVKHCIPIGLNRLIQAAHIDPSLDIIPKITWEYPAGFSDYNTPGKYTFISSDLTNLYEKKLNVTDFTCQESVSIIKTCAKMMVRDALNKMQRGNFMNTVKIKSERLGKEYDVELFEKMEP